MKELIEKQALIDALLAKMDTIDDKPEVVLGLAVAAGMIKALPSVTPAEKVGHWIHLAASDDCSECGWSTGKYISPSKYCPNCGAKMASPTGAEGREE